ncbi:hypothetical protein [Methylomagnum ishizawai]|uniref:hypothetical protein n=1 Tax=Methylomagnum ishizawai TaxID=1760988 RepID=UPI001C33FBD7|nr:hypothetical protein [Methylomagnum ishizawai]BBL75721.1 hypothetical protein MishRS11D_28190 [Methylomagnum ishizawai]
MRKKLASITMLLGLMLALPVQAEIWICDYDGSWSTFGSNNKGRFTWNVFWKGKAGVGWEIDGEYTDRYGKSLLDGNCNDHTCSLTQVYRSGELNGKQYFWKGNYTDEAIGNAKTINRFEGTWGATPSAGDGLWRAVATCIRK